jgi:hypothetical protein
VSVNQKESNQNLDHKLKPKHKKPKQKARISYSPDQKRESVAVFTLPETVEQTQIVCSACAVACCKTLTNKERFCAREENKAQQTAATASARKANLFPIMSSKT